jgi:hypothetical protein
MKSPTYIDLNEARTVLADMGIELSQRQIKRAADLDAQGKRKLPFFKDPIDGRLKIEKQMLLQIYNALQREAQKNSQVFRVD